MYEYTNQHQLSCSIINKILVKQRPTLQTWKQITVDTICHTWECLCY
jgi:hypothetical protein